MSAGDKAKQKAEEMAGRLKKKTGDAIDNEQMQAEGAAKEKKAQAKQAGEKTKDVFGK
ncbi:MAG: CsbD family protein [Streptosporangiales bacterium]|nr:CsbD family protein [Streptosporangiales bacterium]